MKRFVSIRGRLIFWLVSGVIVLTVAAEIGLYAYMEEALEKQLDASLAAKAGEIAHAVHIEEDGQPHLRLPTDAAFTNPNPHHEGQFFYEIRTRAGRLVDRFVPLGHETVLLPQISEPHRRYMNGRLSNGLSVRMTQVVFTPQGDEDETPRPVDPKVSPMVLVVAHNTASIDVPLAVLLSGLSICAVLQAAALVFIVAGGVRRGLHPLIAMSGVVDRVGPESLDLRIQNPAELPTELQPIAAKLNDLLDRLAIAFARERRFSAAVAHELRTPLAELQSACEVALRWPEDISGLTTALNESRDVAVQMSTLVQSLMQLTRGRDKDSPPLEKDTIRLQDAISEAFPQLASVATERSIQVTIELDSNLVVSVNRDLLIAILRNLLTNAVEYTPEHGSIDIRTAEPARSACTLLIENSCAGLSADDVAQLTEPFWRKDASRTGHHTGLGLTLVEHYCRACGIDLDCRLCSKDRLSFALKFHS